MQSDERWPLFDDDEIAAVERVLRSGSVNRWTGDENVAFEQEFAAFVQSDYAVALANGTVALELALRSAGIGPGHDVVVTSRSFVASAGVVPLAGARPVFADVDPVSQNVTVETIRAVLTDAARAVIVVHLGGWVCDMDPIVKLANEHGLVVIEDCAQALGGSRDGRPAGSWGRAATWSFCQDKQMTTGGEGGMLTTNDRTIWERAWTYKDHGKDFAATESAVKSVNFRWVHHDFGSNLRMTEMQAAIGRVALKKVPARIRRRNELARILDDVLAEVAGLRRTIPPPTVAHAYYKYYCFLRHEALKPDWSRNRVLQTLGDRGVPAAEGICPEIYREDAFTRAGFGPADRHPVARSLGETAIMLPIHHNLRNETVRRWASELAAVVAEATVRE